MGDKQTYIIGRSRHADIPLADASVSSRHAEIAFLAGGKVLLTDCKSTNGTYRILTDGRTVRIYHELITATDTLRFGQITLSAKELLETLRLNSPQGHPGGGASPAAQPPAVAGERLVRGACGHIKPADGPCPECGR